MTETRVESDATVVVYRGDHYVRDGRRLRSMKFGFLNNMVLLDETRNTGIQILDTLLAQLLDKVDLRAGESRVRLTLSVEE